MATTKGQAPTRQQLDELDALLQRMLDLPVVPGSEPEIPAPPRAPWPAPSARPEAEPVASVRHFPASYMVVETPPPYLDALEPGLEPTSLPMPPIEPPVPGGRHDLVEDVPADPVQELARRRLGRENGEWVPFQSSWQPSAQTWGPLAETWRQTAPPEAELPPPRVHRPPSPPTIAELPVVPPPSPGAPLGGVVVTEYPPSSGEIPAATAPSPPRSTPMILWPAVAFNAVFDLLTLPLGGWLRRPSGGGFLATVGVLCLAGAALLAFGEVLGWSW